MPDLDHWARGFDMIVLEGCDGVGKTTLAARLAAAHGFAVVHSTVTPDDVDIVQRYLAVLGDPRRLLLDRSFVSELVYGPLVRGRSRLTLSQVIDLAQVVRDRTGTFVHLTASTTVILARLRNRADATVPTAATIERIQHAYTCIFAEIASCAPVAQMDTTQAQ